MPLRALIFDVDGTLAETERDGHRVAFNRAFAEAGLPWHWDEALYGRLLATTGGKERIARWWAEVSASDMDAAHVAELHAAKTRHYAALVRSGALALRPGVRELLADARRRGIALAIATTTTPANVAELLVHSLGDDAPSWFRAICAGDDVPRKKPAPDVYLAALDRLGLPPADCIAFEDSAAGVESSLGAGVPTVLVRGLYNRDFAAPGVLADLDSLAGVDVAVLESWLTTMPRAR